MQNYTLHVTCRSDYKYRICISIVKDIKILGSPSPGPWSLSPLFTPTPIEWLNQQLLVFAFVSPMRTLISTLVLS